MLNQHALHMTSTNSELKITNKFLARRSTTQDVHPATSTAKEEDRLPLADDCVRLCDILADELEDLNIKAANSLIDGDKVVMERNRRKLSNLSSKLETQIDVCLTKNYFLNKERLQRIQDECMDLQIRLEFANKSENQHLKITLPKMNITKFGGKEKEWSAFSSDFISLVHNRVDVALATKFIYIKSLLYGDARSLVEHLLQGSEKNYHAVWTLLNDHYENKRRLFSDAVNAFLDLPILDGRSRNIVQKYICTINKCAYVIKNQSNIKDEIDPILAHIVLRKFESSVLQQYEHNTKKTKQIQMLKDVKDFLEQLVSSMPIATTSSQKYPASYKYKQPQKIQLPCKHCNKSGHNILNCYSFAKLNQIERNKFAKKRKLCVKCLLHNKYSQCNKKISCDICKGYHNTLLHYENKENIQNKSLRNCASNSVNKTRLKSTELKRNEDLEYKKKEIENLKAEILNVNKFRKEVQHKSMDSAISKITPSAEVAVVANRPKPTDVSLTEMFLLYVKTSEELEIHKCEHIRINLQLTNLLHEFSENAQMNKMRELEYEKQQENYQKLMLLVRDLSFKLKEAETPKQQIDETSYQDKIKRYSQKFKKKKTSD